MVVFASCATKKKEQNKLMCMRLEFVALNLSHRSKQRTRRGQRLFGAVRCHTLSAAGAAKVKGKP